MYLEYLTSKKFLKKNGFDSFKDYSNSIGENEVPIEMSIIKFPSPFLTNLNKTSKYLKRRQYYRDPKFRSHPILNIAIELANDFCEWRTEMVEHLWLKDERYAANREIAQKISYRLASKTELLLAKKVFAERKKFIEFKGKSLFKIIMPDEVDNFIILPISELTESEVMLNNNTVNKPKHMFTGFRCVCEIKK